jgi:hypothetical protein
MQMTVEEFVSHAYLDSADLSGVLLRATARWWDGEWKVLENHCLAGAKVGRTATYLLPIPPLCLLSS